MTWTALRSLNALEKAAGLGSGGAQWIIAVRQRGCARKTCWTPRAWPSLGTVLGPGTWPSSPGVAVPSGWSVSGRVGWRSEGGSLLLPSLEGASFWNNIPQLLYQLWGEMKKRIIYILNILRIEKFQARVKGKKGTSFVIKQCTVQGVASFEEPNYFPALETYIPLCLNICLMYMLTYRGALWHWGCSGGRPLIFRPLYLLVQYI